MAAKRKSGATRKADRAADFVAPTESRPPAESARAGRAPLVAAALLSVAVLVSMAALPMAARAYLRLVPENFSEQANTLAAHGATAEALKILLVEWDRHIYNFAAVYQAGEIAARKGTPADCARALDALAGSFDRYLAVKGRDVYSRSWNEARGLTLMAMCLGRLGRPGEGALLAAAAQDIDPVRVNLLLREWAGEQRAALAAMQRNPAPPAWAPGVDALPGAPLWTASEPGALAALTAAPGADVPGAQMAGGADDPAVGLYRRARLRLAPAAGATPDVAPGKSVVLHVAARATPAFEGWPVVVVRAVDERGGAARVLGAFGVRSRAPKLFTIGPFERPAGSIELYYYNDLYDADLKEDRNLFLYAVNLEAASALEAEEP